MSNNILRIHTFDPDLKFKTINDYQNYDTIILSNNKLPKYLAQKICTDIKTQNPDCRIILYTDTVSDLFDFIKHIDTLIWAVHDDASRQAFQDFDEQIYVHPTKLPKDIRLIANIHVRDLEINEQKTKNWELWEINYVGHKFQGLVFEPIGIDVTDVTRFVPLS